jgi:hypothetical protein
MKNNNSFDHKDLSTFKNKSITFKVEELIGRMKDLDRTTIEKEFVAILDDPETSVSKQTRQKWLIAINNTSRDRLMQIISNCYLAGCNMKVPK